MRYPRPIAMAADVILEVGSPDVVSHAPAHRLVR
jgi:hypothetical protein